MFDDLIGKPFKFEGRGPDRFDCWGLSMEVCKRLGIIIPDFAFGCMYAAKEISKTAYSFEDKFKKVKEPKAGDIVAFKWPDIRYVGHIGVAISNDLFMHTKESSNVTKDRLNAISWKRRIKGIYRHINNQGC